MKTIIVSDVHIKSNISSNYYKFCHFIDYLYKIDFDCLILLGDIFDFLYCDAREKYFEKLYDALYKLNLRKIKIYYIYGNHDFNICFKKYSFIKTVDKIDNLKIYNYNSYIMHGDGLNKKEYKYFVLKKILRSNFFKLFYKLSPKKFFYKLAYFFSNISKHTNFYNKKEVEKKYIQIAKNILNNNEKINLLVLAHIHIEIIYTFKDKTYLNTGSFASDGSYVSIIDGLINFNKFQ
jgi:UDP-2,3-diacylglucosamine pyrophosphatase LpxH